MRKQTIYSVLIVLIVMIIFLAGMNTVITSLLLDDIAIQHLVDDSSIIMGGVENLLLLYQIDLIDHTSVQSMIDKVNAFKNVSTIQVYNLQDEMIFYTEGNLQDYSEEVHAFIETYERKYSDVSFSESKYIIYQLVSSSTNPGQGMFVILLSMDMDEMIGSFERMQMVSTLVFISSSALFMIILILILRSKLQFPINNMIIFLDNIREDDECYPYLPEAKNQLKNLSESINGLIQRINQQRSFESEEIEKFRNEMDNMSTSIQLMNQKLNRDLSILKYPESQKSIVEKLKAEMIHLASNESAIKNNEMVMNLRDQLASIKAFSHEINLGTINFEVDKNLPINGYGNSLTITELITKVHELLIVYYQLDETVVTIESHNNELLIRFIKPYSWAQERNLDDSFLALIKGYYEEGLAAVRLGDSKDFLLEVIIPYSPIYDQEITIKEWINIWHYVDTSLVVLVDSFLKELPSRVETIHDYCLARDSDKLQMVLHALKGTSANYQIDLLYEKVKEMEVAVKEEDVNWDKVDVYMERLKRFVKDLSAFTNDSDKRMLRREAENEGSLLIVEDVYENQQLLLNYLDSFNVSIDVANDGIEAIEYLKKKKYAIMFLDMRMPKLSGDDVLNFLSSRETLKPHHIAIVSAHVNPSSSDDYLALGVDKVFVKPIKKRDIIDYVKEHMNVENKMV